MLTSPARRGLADLPPIVSDTLLALIAMVNADTRANKIDVGVGVYRDGAGRTPVMRAVKAAEQKLLDGQHSKSYLGGAGDRGFAKALRPIVLGRHSGDERIVGLQTPGGCGALFLALKLVAAANPDAKVIMGTPTWPNHPPMIAGTGLQITDYRHYDPAARKVDFAAMAEALEAGRPGDVALLHGCCHNPTGADLSEDEWRQVAEIVARRGLLPLIDFAYQGFARGLEQDRFGVELLLDACNEVLITQSCDKNFAVYRDRVGCLFVKAVTLDNAKFAFTHLLQISREAWSMPPDHGAATVRTVLEDEALTADWRAELDEMHARIRMVRETIAGADPRLAYIAAQQGMFSMLPLSVDQVRQIRETHAIYMADSGRANLVGIADHDLERFCAAVVETMNG
ncbi:aromatic amino acid transaminase [Sphingomonas glaciei]|uniref:Aromatic amino acid transaminase n=1 Tax=Sphingomonas glaciei TaxID=2938948 RepID=A0ABY5MXA4_9SPHN|nr:aromatic amino acid transaminase [Sphingomonas glaciei]UUR08400.1 aromatic amino acid transaminase [Sphingomonas glaciei]